VWFWEPWSWSTSCTYSPGQIVPWPVVEGLNKNRQKYDRWVTSRHYYSSNLNHEHAEAIHILLYHKWQHTIPLWIKI
jgi:hypothetical protein